MSYSNFGEWLIEDVLVKIRTHDGTNERVTTLSREGALKILNFYKRYPDLAYAFIEGEETTLDY